MDGSNNARRNRFWISKTRPLPGIDMKVAKAVNRAIVKDVKKRIEIAEFVRALAC